VIVNKESDRIGYTMILGYWVS